MGFLFVLWFVNFGISILNAWGCGKSWNETRYMGGIPHFMNWMGAIMASCGFTWCYMVLLGLVCSVIPVQQDDGTTVMLLDAESLQAFFELGYLVIIGPVLGSGLAITIHSWAVFWRRRTLGNGLVAGWNTAADIYNMASAARNIPSATSHLGSFFKGDDKKGVLVIALVVVAALSGVLTAYFIITTTARSTALHRSLHRDLDRA